jgi:hypothetical protein
MYDIERVLEDRIELRSIVRKYFATVHREWLYVSSANNESMAISPFYMNQV